MKRPSPRDSARHEAAHALVAWLSGIPLKSCEIRRRAVTQAETHFITLGFTRMTDEEDARHEVLLRSPDDLGAAEQEQLKRHLLFEVAGFVAEEYAGTTSQETNGADRRGAMLTAGRLSGGRLVGEGISARVTVPPARKEGAFTVLSEAEAKVKRMLADHEQAWDGRTSLLLQHGSLTGEEVGQFLANHIRRSG
jgi:hypothetical protein